jgi:hypothetical protein
MHVLLVFSTESLEHGGYCSGSDAEYVTDAREVAVYVVDSRASVDMCSGAELSLHLFHRGGALRCAFESARQWLRGVSDGDDDDLVFNSLQDDADLWNRSGYHGFDEGVPEHMRGADCTTISFQLHSAMVEHCAPMDRFKRRRCWISEAARAPSSALEGVRRARGPSL